MSNYGKGTDDIVVPLTVPNAIQILKGGRIGRAHYQFSTLPQS